MIASAPVADATANPLGKVMELMESLTAKITKEGEEEAKAFKEYLAWCDDAAAAAAAEIQLKKKVKMAFKLMFPPREAKQTRLCFAPCEQGVDRQWEHAIARWKGMTAKEMDQPARTHCAVGTGDYIGSRR